MVSVQRMHVHALSLEIVRRSGEACMVFYVVVNDYTDHTGKIIL
jgi:hypothetical protein